MKMDKEMDMEDMEHEVECAVETLLKADEIRADAKLMAKVAEKAKEKQAALKSIASLRKRAGEVRESEAKKSALAEYGVDPELATEEDKATIQEDKKINDNLKKMGLKPKKKG